MRFFKITATPITANRPNTEPAPIELEQLAESNISSGAESLAL